MPEMKNNFSRAKMNKDLDERLVPTGEYRNAMNIQVTTSDGSDVGTVQNILGNTRIDNIIPAGGNPICVGSVTDEKNNSLYWFVKSDNIDYIVRHSLSANDLTTLVFVDTKANTLNAVLKFPNKIITGINIIDNLLFWTDNENEPRKINIDRCIEGTVDENTHTKLIVDGIDYGDIEEENITVVKKRPLETPVVKINIFNPEEEDTEDINPDYLFESKFIRFSTRYKYVDGEYSAFGPFTENIFKAGKFSLPVDEAYNEGMMNRIKSIELQDFVSPFIPKDVVQIDILYKEEGSNVVYSLASIKNTDDDWNATNHDVNVVTNYKGHYIVDHENIYAAVPENQVLRVWDNVPKKALAQEMTGNRIVYGNYTQGYNLSTGEDPLIEVSYKERTINEAVADFQEGGLPSIKSQRNYQLGVVYGDKYGRETPIFTSTKASIKIPWENLDATEIGGLNASQTNQLTLKLQQDSIPSWANYYKVFVKETSDIYHNLLMDRVYQNPIEDKAVEDTIWISFPSSDRNKIQKEDYLILKKSYGKDGGQVDKKNKIKILDISDNAPDSIKYKYVKLGQRINDDVGNIDFLGGSTAIPNSGPALFTAGNNPEPGRYYVLFSKHAWKNANGPSLDAETNNHDHLYFSMSTGATPEDINVSAGPNKRKESQKYRIASIEDSHPTAPTTGTWLIKLENPISDKDSWCVDASNNIPFSNTIGEEINFGVKIERRVKRSLEQFSGRFFVKIVSNKLTQETIEPFLDTTLNPGMVSTGDIIQAYYHTDLPNAAGSYSNTKLLNWNGQGTAGDGTNLGISNGPIWNNTYTLAGNDLTNTYTLWERDEIDKKWFIDSLFVKATQHNTHLGANFSGRGWHGGNLTDGLNGGSDVINGLEGIIIAGGNHVSRTYNADGVGSENYGLRRWQKNPAYWYNENSTYQKLDNTYGNTKKERYYIHLSFSGVGEDLHNSTLYKAQGGSIGSHWTRAGITTPYGDKLRNYSKATKNYAIKNGLGNIMVRGANWKHNGISIQLYNADTVHPLDMNVVNNQWNPGYNNEANKAIIDNLKKGSKFRFRDDPDDERIYEIINEPVVKRLYNHTAWNKVYEYDGGTKSTGDSVEDYARAWADDLGGGWGSTPQQGNDDTKAKNLMMAIERFGLASNRRVCYIIEVDKNPCDPDGNVWDPTNLSANNSNGLGSLGIDADTSGIITFVKREVDVLGNLTSSNPAVWETEPKESADLNIYYEATNAIPFKVDSTTNELFAKAGSEFRLFSTQSLEQDVIGGGEDWDMGDLTRFSGDELPIIKEWESDTVFTVSGLYAHYTHLENGSNVTKWIGKSYGFPAPHGTLNGGETYYVEDAVGADPFNLYVTIYDENIGFVTAKVVSWQMGQVNQYKDFGTMDSGSQILGMSSGWNLYKIEIEPYNSSLPVGLSWYNCISFGNGVESRSVRDDFNSMAINNGVRASSTIEEPYAEENRKSGLIYSGLYNSTSGINNLNQFIAAEKITKDLNPTFGSIQKLFSRRISLIAFCEDRVVGITANKSAVYNADGKPQLVATNAVLGDANPFVGDYGISKNPESFAKESYRAYFTDKQRGTVLRLSKDGLTPISDAGMRTYFKDNLKTSENLIGTYDEYKKDYNLTFANYFHENLLTNTRIEEGSIAFEETSNLELLPDGMFNLGSNYIIPSVTNVSLDNPSFNQEIIIENHDEIIGLADIPSQDIIADPSSTQLPEYGGSYNAYVVTTTDLDGLTADKNPMENPVGAPPLKWVAYANGLWGDIWTGGSASNEWWDGRGLNATWPEVRANELEGDSTMGDFVQPKLNTLGTDSMYQDVKNYFPTATDNTIFNGEEFYLQFNQNATGSNDSTIPRLRLFDLDTGSYVSDSVIVDPIAEGWEIGGTNEITDNTDPRYVYGSPVVGGAYTVGWQNSSDSGWDPNNNGSSVFGGATSATTTYRAYYKVVDTTDPTNTNLPVIGSLVFRLGSAEDDPDDWVIRSFKWVKIRRLKKPKILQGENNYNVPAFGWDGTGETLDPVYGWQEDYNQDGSPAAPGVGMAQSTIQLGQAAVAAYAEVTYSMPYWSNLSGTSWDLTSQAINQVPTGSVSYWDGTGNPPSPHVNYPISTINVGPGSAKKTIGQPGQIYTDISNTPLVSDNWYEVVLNIVDGSYTFGNTPLLLSNALSADGNTYGLSSNPPAGSNLGEGFVGTWQTGGHIGFHQENSTTLKVIFQKKVNINIASSQFNQLRIYGISDTAVEINSIQLNDITDRHSHANPSGSFNYSFNNAGDWSFGNNPSNLHAYSSPVVYFENDKIKFDNAVQGNNLVWNFNNYGLNNGVNFPGESDDGFKVSFKITNYSTGGLNGYIMSPSGNGFSWNVSNGAAINSNGDWVVTGNFNNTTAGLNDGKIYKDGVEVGVTQGYAPATSGWHGKLTFNLDVPTSLDISQISFKDMTNIITGGSIDNWGFNGFDPANDDFIVWDDVNYNIVFNDAPQGVELVQEIPNRNFKTGEIYQLKFDLDNYTGNGKISGYFYNQNGDGFVFGPLTGNQIYNSEHTIGDDTTTDPSIPRNTFVIHVSSPEEFNGTLDNFFLREVFDIDPQTITYSEDVKGWTSFKSFIPENGTSLSSNYYTFQQGRLWQHHMEEDANNAVVPRNSFYGQIENSSLTTLLNNSPSNIKLFNTLSYEGTQSFVPVFVPGGKNETNVSTHNLVARDGWRVESIITDKQQGTIQEFIEKEGKWFNYIKGLETDINTDNFSFQGLGIISNIITPE